MIPVFFLKSLEKNPPDGLESELRGANCVIFVGESGNQRRDAMFYNPGTKQSFIQF